jgi:hypothetical protein
VAEKEREPFQFTFNGFGAPGLIDELDETLFNDRTHEIVAH